MRGIIEESPYTSPNERTAEPAIRIFIREPVASLAPHAPTYGYGAVLMAGGRDGLLSFVRFGGGVRVKVRVSVEGKEGGFFVCAVGEGGEPPPYV